MVGPNGGPGEDLGPLLRRHPAGRPSAVSRLPSPKHHRQRVGPAAVSRLGIAGPDAVFQSLRGNQAVHALQEDLPAGPALLVLVFQVGKEPALVKTGAGSSWNCPTASRPMTPPAFAGQALSEIMARYQGEDRGGPPYHPRMMVKMLPYAYSTGVASSRRVAQRHHEDIAFRVLAANNTPDFRKDHLAALGNLFQQACNCRAVADSSHQVIVAARATNQASDKGQAVAMPEQTIGNIGTVPREVSADAGYYSAREVEGLHARSIDPFIAPDRTRHGHVPPAPQGRIPADLSPRDRMRRKLRNQRGRERYALRKEPVFGQIKKGRGFGQFLLRGREKVNGEWLLICTGHNLLKLFRFGSRPPSQDPHQNWRKLASAVGIRQVGRRPGCGLLRRTGIVLAQWSRLNSCLRPIPQTGYL